MSADRKGALTPPTARQMGDLGAQITDELDTHGLALISLGIWRTYRADAPLRASLQVDTAAEVDILAALWDLKPDDGGQSSYRRANYGGDLELVAYCARDGVGQLRSASQSGEAS